MKTTKTIEIEICDHCGQESRPRKCDLCKREVCDRCADMIHAMVERYSPSISGGAWCSNFLDRLHTKHNGTYCTECAVKVVKALRELRLVESNPPSSGAVLD